MANKRIIPRTGKQPAPPAAPAATETPPESPVLCPDPYYPPPVPPEPAAPQKPTYGFECPKCACPLFRVHNTWGVRGGIRRLRICTHCGHECRTLEKFRA
jgi:hypothetical protein